MTTVFMALTPASATLETYDTTLYNFGTGDFTILAMPRAHSAGALMAYQDAGAKSGFRLDITASGALKFTAWADGTAVEAMTADPVFVLDGACRCIAVQRTKGVVTLLADFHPLPLAGGGSSVSMPGDISVTKPAPLVIGGENPGGAGFEGGLMNVGVWLRALDETELSQAGFAILSPVSDQMAGYWTLDNTTADQSANANPMRISGAVTFMQCMDCLWAHGDNDYRFVQMATTPASAQALKADHDAAVSSTRVITETRPVHVPTASPCLYVSMMGDLAQMAAPPSGAAMRLIDPDGKSYDTACNTDEAFVWAPNGQVRSIAVASPKAGVWRLDVTCPADEALYLQAMAVPTKDMVTSSSEALSPLLDPAGAGLTVEAFGGFWSIVAKTAVAAAAGVAAAAVTAAVVGGSIVAAPAVVAGLAVMGGVSLAMQAETLATMSGDPQTASIQAGGLSGYLVSDGRLQLIDANCDGDPATKIIYKQRKKRLYPAVTASPFKSRYDSLVGSDDTRTNVQNALTSLGPGFVSGSGHGQNSYLMGWYVSGSSGPMEEVLKKGSYAAAEPKDKIFHFFACKTGAASGLGEALVSDGAVAFFGYNVSYAINRNYPKEFCEPDIEIDKALLDGKDCETAHNAAIAKFNQNISRLRADGDTSAAALLEGDRDALRSPVSDARYGAKTARLSFTAK